jgi:hypothetical protein
VPLERSVAGGVPPLNTRHDSVEPRVGNGDKQTEVCPEAVFPGGSVAMRPVTAAFRSF